jgi:nitroreductase
MLPRMRPVRRLSRPRLTRHRRCCFVWEPHPSHPRAWTRRICLTGEQPGHWVQIATMVPSEAGPCALATSTAPNDHEFMTISAPNQYLALAPAEVEAALLQAAAQATLAPSIHNSQPWRFVVHAGRLELFADRDHRVPVVDPASRQLAISCGAALFNARVALAAAQLDVVTSLVHEPGQPDLLASITVVGVTPTVDAAAQRLAAVIGARHSNRRQFDAELVPDDVLDVVAHAAEVEGAWLQPVRDLDDRVTVATLTQHADALQSADPAYRAEVRDWTAGGPDRGDGLPAAVIPHTTGHAHDDIPIRDFDMHGTGELPSATHSRLAQTMLVLGTRGDDQQDWLIAGQALGRVLLELTSAGYVASILSQVTELPGPREQLRHDLRLRGHVQLLIRAGVAEAGPATPRRPLIDVIATDHTTAPEVVHASGPAVGGFPPSR